MFLYKEYSEAFHANTKRLFSAIENLDASVYNLQPDSKWSILEIAEHLWIVEKSVLIGMLKGSATKHEETSIFGQEKLNKIIVQLRARKVVAPEAMEPKGTFTTMQEFCLEFSAQRNKLLNNIAEGNIVIDNSTFQHPYLGQMTMCDWCYFMIAHTERHYLQIQDRLA